MRKPLYLSPSALNLFYEDRHKYYIQYLSDVKPPRDPQTEPMAVGSAFDAYIKSHLHTHLIGKDPQFEFQTLFEAQVESQHRDQMIVEGKRVFDTYMKLGLVADLLLALNKSIGTPKFEASVEGIIERDLDSVRLLGKPDIYFLNSEGCRVIFDWKVNGYFSKWPVSPVPGYSKVIPSWKRHGDFVPRQHKGMEVNYVNIMEKKKPDWGAQMSIYAWLCGEEIGSDFIVAIDQVACKGPIGNKDLNFAQHRSCISKEFQESVFKRASKAWAAIQSGHIFFESDRATSDMLCAALEKRAQAMVSGTPVTDGDGAKKFTEMFGFSPNRD